MADTENIPRRAVIFYNDHWSGDFLRLLEVFGVTTDRLMEYFRKYSEIGIEMSEDPDDEDLQDYFDEAFHEAFSSGCGRGLKVSDYLTSNEAKWDNEFGIVLGNYDSFCVKVNGVLPNNEELVLCYANSKMYELPYILDILTGNWRDGFQRLIRAPLLPAARAFQSLRCSAGRFGVAWADCGESEWHKWNEVEYPRFDDYVSFCKLLGHDSDLLKRAWAAWKDEPT